MHGHMGGSRPAPAPGPLSACEKEEGGLAEEETGARQDGPWGGQQLALPLRMCLAAAGAGPAHWASWPRLLAKPTAQSVIAHSAAAQSRGP